VNLRIIEAWLRRENFLAEDFHFSRYEWSPHGEPTIYTEIEGSRCPLCLTGKRNGKPNWNKRTETRVFYISETDAERIESEYETETGNCRYCCGEAKVVANINFVTQTTTYRPCGKCDGTGKCLPQGKGQEATC
jgi:hypothetical protein